MVPWSLGLWPHWNGSGHNCLTNRPHKTIPFGVSIFLPEGQDPLGALHWSLVRHKPAATEPLLTDVGYADFDPLANFRNPMFPTPHPSHRIHPPGAAASPCNLWGTLPTVL